MEVAVTKFELLSRHLTGDFEDRQKISLAEWLVSLQGFDPSTSRIKVRSLTTYSSVLSCNFIGSVLKEYEDSGQPQLAWERFLFERGYETPRVMKSKLSLD
jgi:hypothetical protein